MVMFVLRGGQQFVLFFFVVFKLFMASGYCDQSADKAANKEKK